MSKKIKTKSTPTKSMQNFFFQYGLTVFMVIIASGLILAVSLLSTITLQPYLNTSSTQTTASSSASITIEQTLIDKINAQKSSSLNSASQTLPSGRSDPFSE